MKESAEKLKESNIRITPQRLGVYRVLRQEARHLTAESIYEKVKKRLPGVSLATVYTILELFKEKNLAQEIRIKNDKSCFEIRVDGHHHFLCRECGRIFDVDIAPCPTLEKKEVDGHSIGAYQGYFYGICRECRKIR